MARYILGSYVKKPSLLILYPCFAYGRLDFLAVLRKTNHQLIPSQTYTHTPSFNEVLNEELCLLLKLKSTKVISWLIPLAVYQYNLPTPGNTTTFPYNFEGIYVTVSPKTLKIKVYFKRQIETQPG